MKDADNDLKRAAREALAFLILDQAAEDLERYAEEGDSFFDVPFGGETERLDWCWNVMEGLRRALDGPGPVERAGKLPALVDPDVALHWALQADAALAFEDALMRSADFEPGPRPLPVEPESDVEIILEPDIEIVEPEVIPEPEIEIVEPDLPPVASSEAKKLCKVCGPEIGPKPVSEFERHGRSKDGYAAKCGECGAEGRRRQIEGARKSRSGEAEVPVVEDDSEASEPTDEEPSKPCVICLKPKPLTDYLESKHSEDGLQSLCAGCRSANGRRGRENSSFGQPGGHSLTPSAVTTIPRAEPITREERFCSNAEECVGFGHIGRPTKLNMLNKTGVCHACEDRDRDRNLSGRVGRRST